MCKFKETKRLVNFSATERDTQQFRWEASNGKI